MFKHNPKFTALLLSGVLGLSSVSFGASTAYAEDSQIAVYTISFDLSEEGVTLAEDDVIEDITAAYGTSVFLPEAIPVKEGYRFSGWTIDGIRGYEAGDVVQIYDNATYKPVWIDPLDTTKYSIHYNVEVNGETLDISADKLDGKAAPGKILRVATKSYENPDALQLGWKYAGEEFFTSQKFVVPDHDVQLDANWRFYHDIIYYAGEVDRLYTSNTARIARAEGIATDLAQSSKFTRDGFDLTGWECSADGKIYKPAGRFVMTYEDVTMTAVWTPINYTVVFNPGTGNKDVKKVQGLTDTSIIVPENTAVKAGYYFDGWLYKDEKYYPGDEFFIYGAPQGLGIALTANWVEGSAPETTTTTSTEVVTTTTTAAPETTTTTGGVSDVKGDANGDFNVSVADATLIMQNIANPDDYKIDDALRANADVDGENDGVTSSDALVIQRYLSGSVESL